MENSSKPAVATDIYGLAQHTQEWCYRQGAIQARQLQAGKGACKAAIVLDVCVIMKMESEDLTGSQLEFLSKSTKAII